jgi:hypothetical protein
MVGINRSRRVSLFVAAAVLCAIVVAVGEAFDPTLFGPTLLDETSLLALPYVPLLQHLLIGVVLAASLFVLPVRAPVPARVLRPATRRAIDKVPISF